MSETANLRRLETIATLQVTDAMQQSVIATNNNSNTFKQLSRIMAGTVFGFNQLIQVQGKLNQAQLLYDAKITKLTQSLAAGGITVNKFVSDVNKARTFEYKLRGRILQKSEKSLRDFTNSITGKKGLSLEDALLKSVSNIPAGKSKSMKVWDALATGTTKDIKTSFKTWKKEFSVRKKLRKSMVGGIKNLGSMGLKMAALNLVTQPFLTFINGMFGPFQSTTRILGSLGSVLGTGFLPIIERVNNFLINTVLPKIKWFSDKLEAFLIWALDRWDQFVDDLRVTFNQLDEEDFKVEIKGINVPEQILAQITSQFTGFSWGLPSIPTMLKASIVSQFTTLTFESLGLNILTGIKDGLINASYNLIGQTIIDGIKNSLVVNPFKISAGDIIAILK